MNDDSYFLFLLLVLAALAWFFIIAPRAKAAREERERIAAEERARREAEAAKLRKERQEVLVSIRSNAPDYIRTSRLEFERQFRSGTGENAFGQDMSPLVCFGYRVGKTNGLPQDMRRTILKYALAADYDKDLSFLPESYRREWGQPLSATRFNRINSHLTKMADLRTGRKNFEVAVSHWLADASWFRDSQGPVVNKFRRA